MFGRSFVLGFHLFGKPTNRELSRTIGVIL